VTPIQEDLIDAVVMWALIKRNVYDEEGAFIATAAAKALLTATETYLSHLAAQGISEDEIVMRIKAKVEEAAR
jgi:hypothetical protein